MASTAPTSTTPNDPTNKPSDGAGQDEASMNSSNGPPKYGQDAQKPPTRRSRAASIFRRKRQTASQSSSSDTLGKSSSDHDSDEDFWNHTDGKSKGSTDKKLAPAKTSPKPNFPQSSTNLFSSYNLNDPRFKSRGKVSNKDGRLTISLLHKPNNFFNRVSGVGLRHHMRNVEHEKQKEERKAKKDSQHDAKDTLQDPSLKIKPMPRANYDMPKLNIVIMVIGSRGDIQPFIKIGRVLKEKHGHRVRIATHPAFKKFIEEDCGLEFFSVGGDPSELMAFMVKNPGLMPSASTVFKGEVGRRRDQMAEMFEGFWRSCIDTTDDPTEDQHASSKEPFVADAIIANPPSFAHVHCAERLGCPLHIIFTFPYTPTQAFPHPLANIKQSSVDTPYANFMSYPLVEMMTWQGLGDLVNDFREKTLGLDHVSTIWAPNQLYRLKTAHTYLWSPALCPKPKDWSSEIDIAGFVFLDLASHFEPPKDLEDFLNAGDKPIYIGFGSIVIDDPDAFTKMIFEATKKAGVRAVLNKGWGGIGGDNVPDNIFMIDNVPHDWLFPRCQAVVHHGGAGTTAIGLKCAKPTMIVPFFGDQPFWGSRVAEAKAGAHECVPYKELDADKFAEGIKQCLTKEAQENVQKIADSIEKEGDGAENAVTSFLARLPMSGNRNLRCSVLQNRTAVWQLKGSSVRLSALAAELLLSQGKIHKRDLRLYRQYSWNDFQGSGGPLTGAGGAVVKLLTGFGLGLGATPYKLGEDLHQHAKHEAHKIRHERRRKARQLAKAKAHEAVEKSKHEIADHTHLGHHEHHEHHHHHHHHRGRSDTTAEEPKEEVEEPEQHEQQSTNHQANRASVQRQDTETSVLSADPETGLIVEVAKDSAMGLWKPAYAILKFPLNLFTGVGLGFHNLPRLYGDTTVRRPQRITGLKSGMYAAGSEFVLETWDAFSGVVTQPYQGARRHGAVGFVSGVGKGLGGLVIKECAAVTAPFGFAMKGVWREATKKWTPVKSIRQHRHWQGQREIEQLTDEQRKEAEEAAQKGWRVLGELWKHAQKIKEGKIIPGQEEVDKAGVLGGVTGRINFAIEKNKWEEHGALENADKMQKFSEGRQQGLALDEIVEQISESDAAEKKSGEGKASSSGLQSQEDKSNIHEDEKEEKENEMFRAPERFVTAHGSSSGLEQSPMGMVPAVH